MKLPSRKARAAWALGAVVAVGVIVVAGLLVRHGKGGGPARGRAAAAAAAPASGAPAPSATEPAAPAVRVIVPSIGADAPVVPEGATGPDGGALDVPADVHVAGWWDGVWQSPSGTVREKVAAPGQSGVALLAGHIDSAVQGKGVFYRLAQAKPGAAVTVIDARHKVTRWKVTRVQTVLKTALPAALFADTGKPRLALVSCGGPFDPATGHYLDNVIAWAVPAT